MSQIATLVSDRFTVQPGLLFTACRAHYVSQARQVAMYLCRKHTQNSLPQIGRFFGARHSSTVCYAIRHVEMQLRVDADLWGFIETFADERPPVPHRFGGMITLPETISLDDLRRLLLATAPTQRPISVPQGETVR